MPLLERDVQRSLVEARQVRPRVGDEDVETAQRSFDLIEHALNLLGTRYVGLNGDPISTALPDLAQRVVCRIAVLVIVNGDLDAALCQLQRDGSPNATRAPSD